MTSNEFNQSFPNKLEVVNRFLSNQTRLFSNLINFIKRKKKDDVWFVLDQHTIMDVYSASSLKQISPLL